MFPKLLLIILTAGAIAAGLLVNRQHRIDAAHEITALHQRLTAQEQTLWELEAEIARRLRPEEVRRHLAELGGEWIALPEPPSDPSRIDRPDPHQLVDHRLSKQDADFGG